MNNIPNIISGLRILFIPIFSFYVLNQQYDIAMYIFIIMGLTDCVDGALARYFNCESLIGAYLDAIADKVMINTAFLILCSINILCIQIHFLIMFTWSYLQ